MAEPNAKPKTGGRKPKAKPTPEGQSTMDFNKQHPWDKPGAGTPRSSPGISVEQSQKIATANMRTSNRTQSGATTRPTGKNTYSRTPLGRDGKPTLSGTPRFSSVDKQFSAFGPGDRTVTNPGAALVPSRQDPKNKVPTPSPGRTPSPSPATQFSRQQATQMPNRARINVDPKDYIDIGNQRIRNNGPRQIGGTVHSTPHVTPSAAPHMPSGGPRLLTGSVAPEVAAVKGLKGMSPRAKGRWMGLGLALGAGAGLTYLATRQRNESEAAAKPNPGSSPVSVPGRNAPPSEGNRADRELYSPAPNEATKKAAEPGLSERVRNNQKANRSPEDYLGEAFDATIKRGRDVGRKHLQGMLVRDSVDSDTASKLMNRYDKEIGAQKTLRDYKSEGIAQKFDRENPGKAGRILDEYRAMGRREGAAPAGATYAQIKERALR